MTYGNVGSVWTFDSLPFVTDNAYQILPPWVSATVLLRGHGMEWYDGTNGDVHSMSRATLVKVANDPPRYERHLPDGTVEVYELADRAASQYNRRIFLTELIDPQGHALTYTYDSSFRMVAITDAIGQVTTLEYLDGADPLRLTRVTDPFGRVATLTYDALGRLASVTDVANLTSSFSYGASDFITVMMTPYGATTFKQGPFIGIEATDPAGGTERLEFHFSNTSLAASDPTSAVPTGFSGSNSHLDRYNSIYWDKQAMALHPGDLTKAVITSWMYQDDYGAWHATARNVPHSIKRPLENRVWYRYQGQVGNNHHGLSGSPPAALIGRVMDDGASQITQMTYNTKGMVTSRIDPLGRQTNYTYATNGIDLLTVEQVRSGGTDVLQSYAGYNSQHLPGTITDAAGQVTTMTYNAAGQPLTVTNAKNETTTNTYESGTGYLLTVTGPVSGATSSYTYDAYGRVESVEDSDGYVVISDYDNLNRLRELTYPDDTTESKTYSRLDLAEQKDRLNRITRHFYDGFGRRIATRDPAGRVVSQVWCDCGSMEALVDANGNRTKWERDVRGRVTREVRADNATDTLYTYDLAGRLKTVTDPKDQVTTHSYNLDDSLSGTAFTDEVIDTPNVSYTYDAYYARVATMVDGIGTTTYTYKAAGTNGAGQVASVDGPLSSDTITYTYDELGRVTERAINGTANTVTWTFDALGRVTSEENLLGEFTYTYDAVTNRLATVTYPNDQTSAYSYFDDEGDHRLQTIHHKYPNTSTLSKFDYTYNAVGNILTWRQQADTTAVLWKYAYDQADQLISAVKHATDTPQTILQRFAYAYDPTGNRTVEQIDDVVTLSAYDNLNRLTTQAPGGPMVIMGSLNEPGTVSISGVPVTVDSSNNFRGTVPTTTGTNTFTIVAKDATGNTTTEQYEVDLVGSSKSFTYDGNGNLIDDGAVTFSWDAKNQLSTLQSGANATSFSYDGDGRWTRLVETQSDVPVRDARQVWCGTQLCEERTSSVAMRRFTSADQVDGSGQMQFKDHLGSLRAVTDLSGVLAAHYSFDPWGRRALDYGNDVSELGFTGLQQEAVSGLWLAMYRPYQAAHGRWLSEDPLGLAAGPNLYAYVDGRAISDRDPHGLSPAIVWYWLVRAVVVYAVVETCTSGWQCNSAWERCRKESVACANRLSANIMSPQYQQRVQICFEGNSSCQTMRAVCPGWLMGMFPYPRRM